MNAEARLLTSTIEAPGKLAIAPSPRSATDEMAVTSPATLTFALRWVDPSESASLTDSKPSLIGNSEISQSVTSDDVTKFSKADGHLLMAEQTHNITLSVFLLLFGSAAILFGSIGASFLYERSEAPVPPQHPPLRLPTIDIERIQETSGEPDRYGRRYSTLPYQPTEPP
jgi:hypothetical protein